MYEVPRNIKPISKWSISIISLYYMLLGSLAAIYTIPFFVTMIYSDMLYSHRILSTLWLTLILLANASRFGVFIGLMNYRRWAYWGSMVIETITIVNAVYTLFFSKLPIFIAATIVTGTIAILILGYLFRPKVWRTFLATQAK